MKISVNVFKQTNYYHKGNITNIKKCSSQYGVIENSCWIKKNLSESFICVCKLLDSFNKNTIERKMGDVQCITEN